MQGDYICMPGSNSRSWKAFGRGSVGGGEGWLKGSRGVGRGKGKGGGGEEGRGVSPGGPPFASRFASSSRRDLTTGAGPQLRRSLHVSLLRICWRDPAARGDAEGPRRRAARRSRPAPPSPRSPAPRQRALRPQPPQPPPPPPPPSAPPPVALVSPRLPEMLTQRGHAREAPDASQKETGLCCSRRVALRPRQGCSNPLLPRLRLQTRGEQAGPAAAAPVQAVESENPWEPRGQLRRL